MTGDPKSAWRFGSKIVIPMVAATIAAIVLAGFGLYWTTKQSDAISIERQTQTTRRAIDDIVARLALEQETVAVWDDTVTYLHKRKVGLEWINLNIGIWPHKIFGHDQTYIVNARDEPVYASIGGKMVPKARFEAIRADVQLFIAETRGKIRGPNGRFDRHRGQKVPGAAVLTTERAFHHTEMARIDGRPAAVSVMLIRAATPKLQPPGPEPVMINIRFLDRAFLRELEHRNLIDRPRFSLTPQTGRDEKALELNRQDGARIGYLIWRPQLPGSRILSVLALQLRPSSWP